MLEIACFNAESAITAIDAGADRIELCADYAAGGVSPSLETLEKFSGKSNVPVNVMIRPRAGDFVYSDKEFEEMISDIGRFKSKSKASGFVFGILDDYNHVDVERNKKLVQKAAPLPCTFHRAFDQIENMPEAIDQLVECGFRSILTSGGEPNAVSGATKVAELQERFGAKISLILGGGVRSTNIQSLKEKTKVDWYHSAAITKGNEVVDKEEVVNLQSVLGKADPKIT